MPSRNRKAAVMAAWPLAKAGSVRYSKKAACRPFEKMLFARDTPYDLKAKVMAEQRALLEALEQPREIVDAVFGGTAARILGIES